MKNVTIYCRGSRNHDHRMGWFLAGLECDSVQKHVFSDLEDATADQCLLVGFIEAVMLIKEPCRLRLVCATEIAFTRTGQPRGRNKELKRLLLRAIKARKCEAEFDIQKGCGRAIKQKLAEIERAGRRVECRGFVTEWDDDERAAASAGSRPARSNAKVWRTVCEMVDR